MIRIILLALVISLCGCTSSIEIDMPIGNKTWTLPRKDLHVTVYGVKLTPELGLESTFTLSGTEHHAQVIGDLRLLANEVNPLIHDMIRLGIDITSLHSTFLTETPRLMSLHFSSAGTAKVLTHKIQMLLQSMEIVTRSPQLSHEERMPKAPSNLDPLKMEALLWKGDWTNGVYRISRGRGTQMGKYIMGESEGVLSWAAFTGTEEHAFVTGDLGTIEPELREVLRALVAADIQIVSVHTHLIRENPKLIFVHYLATGKLEKLAAGIKKAIEVTEHHQSN